MESIRQFRISLSLYARSSNKSEIRFKIVFIYIEKKKIGENENISNPIKINDF